MPATVLAPVAEPRRLLPPESILPPIIARPAANLWLWVLPIALLLGLNVEGYGVVEGNMNDTQRHLAWLLGAAAIANLAGGLLMFFVTRRLSADSTPSAAARWWWGVPAVATNAAYLWFALWANDQVLPENVWLWIYPLERFAFNQLSFAMLPLFFGVLQIACMAPAKHFGSAFGTSLAMAIGGPILMFTVLAGFGSFGSGTAVAVILATLVIATSLTMFIGIIRCVMLLMRAVQGGTATTERLLVAAIALVLPAGGLLLNRAIPFPVDFQAWEVYALMLANAAILLLSAWKQAAWPRASFNLLCATLPFTLYFFVVLLPYTPLAIFAVIIFGLGFLILTPTLLLSLHVYLLTRSARALPSSGLERTSAIATGALCFLLLPGLFVGRGLADKAALNAALDFVATPSVQTGDIHYTGDHANLQRALANHRHYKNGIYYPLLSDFYSWLVFDNLVLPDPVLARLEQTFIGTAGDKTNRDPVRMPAGNFFGHGSVRARTLAPRARPTSQTVEIAELEARVTPKTAAAVLTLALTLRNTGSVQSEFRETLPLPAGVFVSGFRLQVGDTLVPGRIFEKKTAQWVYTMIRDSERRDPGLLVYNNPHELQLSVFPVDPHKTTKVEIDFLVPQSLSTEALPLKNKNPVQVLTAVGQSLSPHLVIDHGGGFLVSGMTALSVPAVQCPIYLHLIIDRSEANGFTGDVASALKTLAQRFPDARSMRMTLANYDVIDALPSLTPMGAAGTFSSATLDRQLPVRGGFALDLALAHALRQHRDADLDFAHIDGIPARPVFIVLSRKAASRQLNVPLAESWAEIGGGLEIHELDQEMSLVTHRTAESKMPLVRLANSIRPLRPNTSLPFAAVPAKAHLEYWSPVQRAWRAVAGVDVQEPSTAWGQAAALAMEHQEYTQNPGVGREKLAGLVHRSRETAILLPTTSYIVVENQAQWRMLELGEKQKLGQNRALEFHEAPAPSFWILGGGFALWAWARGRFRRRGR